jgi:hypothetical protein
MGRYLKIDAANLYLNLGKTIEVFLGRVHEDKKIITYLLLTKSGTKIRVQVFDHYDEGSLECIEIYAFPYVEPDLDFETYYMSNLEEIIEFVQLRFKQHTVAFVNRGKSQHEYEDMLLTEGLKANKFSIGYDSIIWN